MPVPVGGAGPQAPEAFLETLLLEKSLPHVPGRVPARFVDWDLEPLEGLLSPDIRDVAKPETEAQLCVRESLKKAPRLAVLVLRRGLLPAWGDGRGLAERLLAGLKADKRP